MNLPSMVLASAFSAGVWISALTVFGQAELNVRAVVILASLPPWRDGICYRRFRLPFSMFLLGLPG